MKEHVPFDTEWQTVLFHMQSGKEISKLQAFNQYGIMELAQVIHYLRDKKGLRIAHRTQKGCNLRGEHKHWHCYYMPEYCKKQWELEL